ncbi:MAG TPA: T9SS type A sorting domain-containing protein, partial [Bacteroidia bacterium]|nr:T9SS type A sorting domain-containing protein [Bacteroidia bacterium]
IITTVPVNSILYYNGVALTNNTTITNYAPSQLQVKFTEPGSLNTSFQYEMVDAAGNHSATPAIYLISWASTLPVVLTSFTAEKENSSALLKWTTSSETNVKVFNIERSIDNGKTWQAVGEVAATGQSSDTREYSFIDDNPENGTNLYRLQIQDDNGSVTYSSIVTIEIADESAMNVYPNPVGEDEALNIQLTGLKQGQYHIRLIASNGQTVKDMTFTISSSGSALLVIPTGTMTRGSYVVVVSGNDLQYTKTVIVANR